ncbi:hypothetical protein HDU79_001892 [Rhizoclosmatium sp. JEL0117]|nr:hypothetical protein HDU79_001892 [Rhizoclosmatium sp. JEL0117]
MAIENSNVGSSTNVGLIAGVIVCVVLSIVAVVVSYIYWTRKRRDDAERQAAVARYTEPFFAGRKELAPLRPLSSIQGRPRAQLPPMATQPIMVNNVTFKDPSELIPLKLPVSPVPVVQLVGIGEKATIQDFYSNNLAAPGSENSNAYLNHSQVVESNLPQDPYMWSIAEAATWIAQNGGRVEGAKRAAAQLIDGNALLVAEDPKEVLDIVQCETYGERMRLKNALIALNKRVKEPVEPPSYVEFDYDIVDLTESGTSISTSTNLPQDPSTWSVTEVAVWIAQNGGRIDGAKRASMQLIDGQALMAAEDVKDIMDIVQCETYGERMRLKNALSVLKGRKEELDAPPSYSD